MVRFEIYLMNAIKLIKKPLSDKNATVSATVKYYDLYLPVKKVLKTVLFNLMIPFIPIVFITFNHKGHYGYNKGY